MIPVGDPDREILTYYLDKFPYMVELSETDYPADPEPLYTKYRQWIQVVWSNPPRKMLTTKEASMRWDICKTCPFNVKKDWPSSKESEELSRRSFMLRLGIDVPKEIGFCSLHNADLSVLSFVDSPEKFSGKKKESEKPEPCWV